MSVQIILAFVLAFIQALNGFFYKKIIIQPITMSLILTILTFIVFSIKTAINYNKEKRNNKCLENPFKKIFTVDALKIGLSGTFIFLILLFAVKKLPLTFVIPLSLIWMVFAIIFAKILLNEPITKIKIIGLSLVIVGILVMNYHHFKLNTIDFNRSTIIFLIIFLLSQVVRGYQLTEIKKLEKKHTTDELLIMDFGINLISVVIIFIIYRLNPMNKWSVSPLESKKVLFVGIIILGTISVIRSYLRFSLVKSLPEISYVLIVNTSLIFTVILSYLFLGEHLTWNQFVGAGILLYGIFKTNSKVLKDNQHIQ